MLIRLFSDLHLEFQDFYAIHMPQDHETVLVLAGDTGLVHKANLKERIIPFLQRSSEQFRAVVMILGNHEHYRGSFLKTYPILKAAIKEAGLMNVHLLEKEQVVIDDVCFIGSTLWTNCGNHDPMADLHFYEMTDAKVIRTGTPGDEHARKFSVSDLYGEHVKARKYIKEAVAAAKELNQKTVVVVHHGVTRKSIDPVYIGTDALTKFYVTEMTEFWYETNPDYVFHGHVHHAFDYYVDEDREWCQTRVITNPRGYPKTASELAFGEMFTIDI